MVLLHTMILHGGYIQEDKVIRKGRVEDINLIIDVGKRLLHKSNNRDVPVSKNAVFNVIREFVRAPDKVILVAGNRYRLSGLIMAAAETFWWDDPRRGRRYVTDWCFYSEISGDGLRMLDIVTRWAWSLPRVVEVNVARNFTNAEDSADKLFKKAGFKRAGAMYTAKKLEVL